jgi:Holliday junction resolvasome RuvABC endonuclease subunit
MQSMIYIGIDPSIVETAWVALDDKGKVLAQVAHVDHWNRHKPDEKKPKRLEVGRLRQMVDDVVRAVTTQLLVQTRSVSDRHIVAIEEPFVGENGASALKTYAVFAGIIVALIWPELDTLTVPPTTLKKFVGAKKKVLIAREVYKRWGFQSDDHNIVDAYAIARWAMSQRNGS